MTASSSSHRGSSLHHRTQLARVLGYHNLEGRARDSLEPLVDRVAIDELGPNFDQAEKHLFLDRAIIDGNLQHALLIHHVAGETRGGVASATTENLANANASRDPQEDLMFPSGIVGRQVEERVLLYFSDGRNLAIHLHGGLVDGS